MEEKPLVSVIMPAYNAAQFIKDAILSIQLQTYSNWELYIINDASVDNTASITSQYAVSDPRIHIIENSSNKGTGVSRNLGIAACRGVYIAFLDSDDVWLPHKLEVQVAYMHEHDLAMSFSSYGLMAESGEPTGVIVEALPVLTYKKLLRSNYVGNLTGMYNREKLGKVYAPKMRKRQDWALWLDILQVTGEVPGIKKPLAMYRIRNDSISNNKLSLLKYNFGIYYSYLQFGWIKSVKYMTLFLWEHFRVKNKQVKLNKGSELF